VYCICDVLSDQMQLDPSSVSSLLPLCLARVLGVGHFVTSLPPQQTKLRLARDDPPPVFDPSTRYVAILPPYHIPIGIMIAFPVL
jgi:hypothetical protein